MKRKAITTLLLLAAAAYAAAKFIPNLIKKNFVDKLKFQFKDIKLDGTNIAVRIAILNPTSNAFSFDSFVGSLYYGGNQVAKIKTFTKTIIKPSGETDVTLTFVPSAGGILVVVSDLVTGSGKHGFTLSGTVNISGASVPVKMSF